MTGHTAPRRPDEAQRLDSLRRLRVMDTAGEPVFDWLVDLAASTLDAPLAIITLVDENRVWIKASAGRSQSEAPRDMSLCDWVVSSGAPFEVHDAEADPRFRDGAMADAGLRSYTGAPIFGVDGQPVGALCVLHKRVRRLKPRELAQLEQIAELVTGQLHLKQWRSIVDAGQGAQASGLEAVSIEALSMELRQAITDGQIVPAYQPIVTMNDRRTVGCEALARWEHPTRGLLTPAAFLDVAARDDKIIDIDITVMDQALRQVGRWYHNPSVPNKPGVSLNVSARLLAQPDLVRHVRSAIETYHVPPRLVTLEMTEAVLAGADSDAVSVLTKLRDLGVVLGIDDFGTAHSSLSYLHKFPVNCIKIDVGFIAGLGTDVAHERFVDSILGVARRLDMDTIAVGVETEDQAAILRRLGCPKAQGYLYAAPLSAKALGERLVD